MMGWLSIFQFERLMHPWALVLLVGVIALLLIELIHRPAGVVLISTGDVIGRIRHHQKAALRRTPAVLRALGLGLLVLALARPMVGLRPRVQRTEVVDIMLTLDVSGSMKALDFLEYGEPRDRLHVSKESVRDFIERRKLRRDDRFGVDRMGLILYAGYAWTQTPLTLDYAILERDLENAHIDETDPEKRGTAIGSAIGLAMARLLQSEAESRVIVMLTDGRNNRGELDPITAAQIAADYGIRIYTVGVGTRGDVLIPQQTAFGERLVPARIPIDDDMLQRIADLTGGRYYRVTDTEMLYEAYAEIDELETTEIEIGDYYEHEEGFAPWALAGMLLLGGSIFSRRMWFDPIP